MTGREKIEAALSETGSPEIAVVIPYEDILIRDHWRELTHQPWWDAQSTSLETQTSWRRDVIKAIGQDWLTLPHSTPRDSRDCFYIEVRSAGVFRVDRRDGREKMLHEPATGGWSGSECESYRPTRIADTIEEIDEMIHEPSPVSESDFQSSGVGDLSSILLSEFGDSLIPICRVGSPLWSCYGLWGFEDMMAMVASQPKLVEHATERYLARRLNSVRNAALLGAKAIWIEECLTDMIAPDAFNKLNVPIIRRLIEEVRALGMKSLYYYCGNPMDRLDSLLSVGADALALEESKKGFQIDICDVADIVGGDCALFGNLDSIGVLQNGTDDDLKREIERQIEAGRRNRGRFIMSLGSPVTPGTTVERVRLYCDLAREIGGQ